MACSTCPPSATNSSAPAAARGSRTRPLMRLAEPTKSATKRFLRLVVDLLRRADLLDHAHIHHDHPVGDGERLLLVVRDVDRGDVEPALQLAQLDAHLGPQLGIEVAERLVEQHHGRREGDGAGQRHALLLAAGELGGRPVGEMAHLHQVERALDIGLDLGRCPVCARAARRPRCRTRSCAATRRRTGTPWRRRAARSARCGARRRRTSSGRRCGCCRRSAAPARRWRASVVVLPQPEGPSRVTCSPRPTLKLTPLTATASP